MEDNKTIIEFLDETKMFLGQVVEWGPLLFPSHLREHIIISWLEISNLIENVKNEINKLDIEQLNKAGLTGNQLIMKLNVFRYFYKEFEEKGGVWRLKKVLGLINIILGSIASVIPGGEAIKEFKETIEKAIVD